jgi:transcriptional regulator with XRE-family HTH domain
MTPKLCTEADRTIGGRIAAIRAAQGLSQTMLGAAIGVSFQQVQKYEKGRNRIGAGRLQEIAKFLGVDAAAFYSDAGPTLPSEPTIEELRHAFFAARNAYAAALQREASAVLKEAA